ncbi:MAG: nitroreductase family protein [Flavobacteriaceae bacterium]|tara:strand:- start:507 stop:1238 length:732 start_codon:yes stop_codon:yes gene_type:complete
MLKTVSEAIEYRRSVRKYLEVELDVEKVKNCIRNATLAPNSSNMQLWEFYHITDKETLKKLSKACFDQNAAKTAVNMVVFVARRDKWRKRAKENLNFLEDMFDQQEKDGIDVARRRKVSIRYYKNLMPTIYTDFFGLIGFYKKILSFFIGLFRPIYREVLFSDLKVITHKSVALAAQNFMLSMAEIGYDTCPMEGSDTTRVKKILKLPSKAEINMIVACGIRSEKGVYTERFRVPFDEVYRKI